MTAWELYWLIKLDAIGSFACATTVVFGLATVALIITGIVLKTSTGYYRDTVEERAVRVSKDQEMGKTTHKYLFLSGPLFVISAIVVSLLPSTKQMCAIIVVPKVINVATESEALKAIPGKVLNLADDWIDKLSPQPEQVGEAIEKSEKTP